MTTARGKPVLGFTESAVDVAYLAIDGTHPTSIQISEDNRVSFAFRLDVLSAAQTILEAGQGQVDPVRFAAILQRVVRSNLTHTARKRIRQEQEMTGGQR